MGDMVNLVDIGDNTSLTSDRQSSGWVITCSLISTCSVRLRYLKKELPVTIMNRIPASRQTLRRGFKEIQNKTSRKNIPNRVLDIRLQGIHKSNNANNDEAGHVLIHRLAVFLGLGILGFQQIFVADDPPCEKNDTLSLTRPFLLNSRDPVLLPSREQNWGSTLRVERMCTEWQEDLWSTLSSGRPKLS